MKQNTQRQRDVDWGRGCWLRLEALSSIVSSDRKDQKETHTHWSKTAWLKHEICHKEEGNRQF